MDDNLDISGTTPGDTGVDAIDPAIEAACDRAERAFNASRAGESWAQACRKGWERRHETALDLTGYPVIEMSSEERRSAFVRDRSAFFADAPEYLRTAYKIACLSNCDDQGGLDRESADRQFLDDLDYGIK